MAGDTEQLEVGFSVLPSIGEGDDVVIGGQEGSPYFERTYAAYSLRAFK